MRNPPLLALCLGTSLLLAACVSRPPVQVPDPAPAQWHAPLPHGGEPVRLADWWRGQGDALLVELIESAQAASPTLTSAASRIAEARAARVAAGAALGPTLDGSVAASRGNSLAAGTPSAGGAAIPPLTMAQAGLQANWEIDLFGAGRATRDAAQAQLEGAQARWHAARISVAADTALLYYDERTCQRELAVLAADTRSRAETARLTGLAADAGFQAPASAALTRASASDAASRLAQQRMRCTLLRKGLVALTGIDAAVLERKLATAPMAPFVPGGYAVASVPAAALAQRPDVYAAEQAVAAASAEVGAAQARRYPRLSLQGSIGRIQFRGGGLSESLDTWSIGPLALTLPIFDGGTRAANAEAAQARYDEAVSNYRANVRQAVREVEEALVTLQTTQDRFADTQAAVRDYQASFNATQARHDAGLASLFELEDARRTLLLSQTALLGLERERAQAFVALYRAVGGGWTRPEVQASQRSSATSISLASVSP